MQRAKEKFKGASKYGYIIRLLHKTADTRIPFETLIMSYGIALY